MTQQEYLRKLSEARDSNEIAEITRQFTGAQVRTLVRSADGSVGVATTVPAAAPAQALRRGEPDRNGMIYGAVETPDGTVHVLEGFSPSGLDVMARRLIADGGKVVKPW